jgi:hypothetical protein
MPRESGKRAQIRPFDRELEHAELVTGSGMDGPYRSWPNRSGHASVDVRIALRKIDGRGARTI